MTCATVFPDVKARKAGTVPLARLLEALTAGRPRRDAKADCPLFSPFEFGVARTEAGSLRSTANAGEACAIVAEHDNGTIAPEAARDTLAAYGIAATLYTTASHAPEAPRWRIVAPTSRPIAKADYPRMVARLNGLFAGAIASESFTVAQSFYFGRVNGRPFESYTTTGDTLDTLDDLDAHAIYPDHAKRGEGHDGDAGTGSATTDTEHRETIHTGRDGVQRALLALAARWIARGMVADDVAAALAELLDACEWKDANPKRWATRRASVRRCVDTAAAKFADRREAPADDARAADHAGPAPVDILRPLAAPPLRIYDVPDVLALYAQAQADATGWDVSIMLAAGIGAACAALSDDVRLSVAPSSGWFESARLWLAVVAGPGSGKSPGSKTMLAPIFAMHREGIGQWQQEHKDDDEPPPMPALYTSDSTTEALAETLRGNERGLLYFVDELESWLASHDAYRSSAGKDRGEWLRLYDGGPHQVNRIKRGAFFVQNWGCSLLSATTPAALRKLAPKLPDDGLLQRLLLVVARPSTLPEDAPMRVIMTEHAAAWDAALRRLHAQPATVVRLSSWAREAFEHERADLHRLTLAFEDSHPSLASHMAKRTAMLARLALVFHALTSDDMAADLPGATMQQAARFLRRQERHAMAVYGSMLGADTGMALARDIARAILATGLESFNRRELTPRCKAFRAADEPARHAALTLLADCGWLAVDSRTLGHGAQWHVDPRVHELFAEHGEAARQRRELVRARMAEPDE